MRQGKAEQLVIVSAATVGGVYAYLKWKGQAKTPAGEFVTAWGVVFFTLSLVATAAPGVAGGLAAIIMASDLLANTPALVKVIQASGVPTGGQGGSASGSAVTQAGQGIAHGAASVPGAAGAAGAGAVAGITDVAQGG